jgi:hypothetical protein
MSKPRRQTIIEFVVSGQFGQVSAIDVASGMEVSVIVPAQTAKLDRETLALRKLDGALKAAGYLPDAPAGHKEDEAQEKVLPKKRGLIA